MMSIEKLPDPILITGCARSGTSMIAGSIALCGAFGGITVGPNRHNAKGMFENYRIREAITKPYLRSLGVDPLGQYPLPDVATLLIPNDWRAKVEQVFRDEGYKSGPLFYKGAKCCLFWPVWHHAFPNARWIIVRRHRQDIITSCMKTGFMRAFGIRQNQRAVGASSEKEGWAWWVEQHLIRFREMQDAGLNCRVIWPEKMIQGDYQPLYETMEWLGLEWNSKVLSFIDPKLWRARRK